MSVITILLLLGFCIFFPISLFYSPIAYTAESAVDQFDKILEEYFAIHGFTIVLFMIILFVAMFLNSTKTNKNVAKVSFAVSLASFSYFLYVIIDVFRENMKFAAAAFINATWSFNAVFIILVIFVGLLLIVNIINFIMQLLQKN